MKKIAVSVGIPAFNEDANIKNLLNVILTQKGSNFKLKEIIVVSDCSTDKTVAEVKSLKDKRIRLIENKKRSGQAVGQNKIVDLFSGDILILLNADVIPEGTKFIGNLVSPLLKSNGIGIVSPKIIPVKAQTFFEKIINYSVEYRESMLSEWNDGNNILHCHGAARAFSRDFAKKIRWSSSVGEDAYTYFLCITSGLLFKHQPKAKLLYRSPDNLADYKKQSTRFIGSQQLMSTIFRKELVISSYQIPLGIKIKKTLLYFLKNPIYWIIYASTFLSMYLMSNSKQSSNSLWDASKSSKSLISK